MYLTLDKTTGQRFDSYARLHLSLTETTVVVAVAAAATLIDCILIAEYDAMI
jgi:hypothetical protein